ncbi:hypothetical protein CBE01nite_22860 [Clostridium beijerinckii]|uniref:Dioxygenase n=2 Tax=Clostridium diolis TaxID=223919 RepID=A0AAV3V921_9CLOT|nr:aromatic ring-opening dioxygenase catalytic subunit (LigB family) [Clostridium beijerinckii]OOM25036.1 hypothetical protein CLBEI_17200 [Clostridium beijerinckii]GEA30816.1 hypothetical protein CDIOL_17390 [Clostridium diolis]GEP64518.1 hypothetical protein CBE01nite_22860 [Clostridium beijerinckii]SQB01291.1 Uncharacterised protein [Clostridium beijerinckii]
MNDKIMSVVFAGHGSPMVALDNNEITEGMQSRLHGYDRVRFRIIIHGT